jgi:hypothetical protein
MEGIRAKLHDLQPRSLSMQRSQLRQPVQPTVPAQRSGPVPLDPKDLQQVAGGAPRGGWQDPSSTDAPRGGWL